jgi:arylsulfatase
MPAKPNILLILNDDMGYSDLGCYGGEIQTPNLDALAGGGVRFTQCYTTARCCPSRASLLTGLYPQQADVGHMMDDDGVDGYLGDLSPETVTIAEALKPAGYRTYMSGKWHVSRFIDGPQHNWPCQRGFDDYYGILTGAANYYQPRTLTRGNVRRLLLYRCHLGRGCAAIARACARSRRGALFPVRGLHRAPLAAPRL